jgi:hypothetical protein
VRPGLAGRPACLPVCLPACLLLLHMRRDAEASGRGLVDSLFAPSRLVLYMSPSQHEALAPVSHVPALGGVAFWQTAAQMSATGTGLMPLATSMPLANKSSVVLPLLRPPPLETLLSTSRTGHALLADSPRCAIVCADTAAAVCQCTDATVRCVYEQRGFLIRPALRGCYPSRLESSFRTFQRNAAVASTHLSRQGP